MDSREAVKRFVVSARDLAGRAEALADAMEPFYGELPAASTVRSWMSGEREPLARALFAMARAYPELSLDEYAREEPEERTLEERVRDLERKMAVIIDRVGEMGDDQGLSPLEFPGA